MAREILFRGLRTDGKGFVYGSLINNQYIIGYLKVDVYNSGSDSLKCECVLYTVIPETVGQFTGLTDKNGTRIFEGDLIEVHNNKNLVLKVEFINAYVGGWVLTHHSSEGHASLGARESDDLVVIGNIHEQK